MLEVKNIVHRPRQVFTQVPTCVINDKFISCKAKAVYMYFISKPEEWQFYTSEIANNFKESYKTIVQAINELIEFGYIIKNQERKNGKFSHNIYEVFYEPQEIIQKEEIQDQKKHTRSNTKESYTVNNEELKISFQDIFEKYGSKGSLKESLKYFKKLSDQTRILIVDIIYNEEFQKQQAKKPRQYITDFENWITNNKYENVLNEMKYSKNTTATNQAKESYNRKKLELGL